MESARVGFLKEGVEGTRTSNANSLCDLVSLDSEDSTRRCTRARTRSSASLVLDRSGFGNRSTSYNLTSLGRLFFPTTMQCLKSVVGHAMSEHANLRLLGELAKPSAIFEHSILLRISHGATFLQRSTHISFCSSGTVTPLPSPCHAPQLGSVAESSAEA